jgi:hypothetical protein
MEDLEEDPAEEDRCAPGGKKTQPKKTTFSNRLNYRTFMCAAVGNRGARAGADGRFEDVSPWITSAVNSGDNTEPFTFGLGHGHSEGNKGVTRHGQVDGDTPTGTG